jgi:tRNA A37 threonylcarbamoyladenosine dehydratase
MDVRVEADLERRFGGLRRLYGDAGYERLRQARVAVVGLGGVGSWTVEALARCGVAGLVLVDLDHVAESNIHRQVQALGSTLGMAKVRALAERVADIHPACEVSCVEAFVDGTNWPAMLPGEVHAAVDACDEVRAKVALAGWALHTGLPFVAVGAAGGKQAPQRVEVADLGAVTHDPLLSSLRRRLRKEHGARNWGEIGVHCVFSREAVQQPGGECEVDGSLNCAGYGSSVTVTATFGMVAANEIVLRLLSAP